MAHSVGHGAGAIEASRAIPDNAWVAAKDRVCRLGDCRFQPILEANVAWPVFAVHLLRSIELNLSPEGRGDLSTLCNHWILFEGLPFRTSPQGRPNGTLSSRTA